MPSEQPQERAPIQTGLRPARARGRGRRPPVTRPSKRFRGTFHFGAVPPARCAHRRRAMRFEANARPASMRSTRSAVGYASSSAPTTRAIHGQRVGGSRQCRDNSRLRHAAPSLVVACDDELRPGARTCAPEPRDIAACRATRCFRAVPPPAPCRSSAAVSVAGSLNPPSMARCLGDLVEPACGRLNAAIAIPCGSERAKPAPVEDRGQSGCGKTTRCGIPNVDLPGFAIGPSGDCREQIRPGQGTAFGIPAMPVFEGACGQPAF